MNFQSDLVLIIDDSSMYRTAAKGMLQKLGFQAQNLHFANDAHEALQKARTHAFQLVLCDYNLGEKANGYQLIDQLQSQQLLPADCSLVIVTGDGTPDVVRGFAELEPDGYLLKPLNYVTLKERLPIFMRKKKSLSDMLLALHKKDYPQVLELVEQAYFRDSESTLLAQQVKIEAHNQMGDVDLARNGLISMINSDKSFAHYELAKISFKKRQFKEASYLLSTLEKDATYKAKVSQLNSDIAIQLKDFQTALEHSTIAVACSPKVIQRHWQKVYLELIGLEFGAALQSTKTMIGSAKFSFRESTDMYLLGASLLLDTAQVDPTKNLAQVANWCEVWRKRFNQPDYKPFELLVFSRGYIIRNNLGNAKQFIRDYEQYCVEHENHIPSSLELIEQLKVYQLLKKNDKYQQVQAQLQARWQETLDNSCHYNNKDGQAVLIQLQQHALSQWRSRLQIQTQQLTEVKQQCQSLLKQSHYEKAIHMLVEALPTSLNDLEVPFLLMGALTKSWPLGWNRRQVSELVMRCHAKLTGSSYERNMEYRRIALILSKKLELTELSIQHAS